MEYLKVSYGLQADGEADNAGQGGRTVADNCRILRRDCNRCKGGK